MELVEHSLEAVLAMPTKQKETTAIKTILVLTPLKPGPGKLRATALTPILFRLGIPEAAKPTPTR